MIGTRLLIAAAVAAYFLAAAPNFAYGRAARVSLPVVVVDTTIETRSDSRDPSSSATTFFQQFKIAPWQVSLELPGASVSTQLSFLARIEGEDSPLAGGRIRSEYGFNLGGSDRFGRLRFGYSQTENLLSSPRGLLMQ